MNADHDMTTAEAAELMRISTSEIRSLCRMGVIACTKRASRWYLSRSAVAAYLHDRLEQIETQD